MSRYAALASLFAANALHTARPAPTPRRSPAS